MYNLSADCDALARETTLEGARTAAGTPAQLRPSYAPFVWPAIVVVGSVIVFPWAFREASSVHSS